MKKTLKQFTGKAAIFLCNVIAALVGIAAMIWLSWVLWAVL